MKVSCRNFLLITDSMHWMVENITYAFYLALLSCESAVKHFLLVVYAKFSSKLIIVLVVYNFCS